MMADEDDLNPDDLRELFNDDHQREQRTLRHEAGHATVAWIIRDDLTQPPFEYIEVGTIQEQAGGVVPGGVKFDVDWFDTLPPVDQGAILLAGVYVQDVLDLNDAYSADEWRDVLDGLEGADGVDDYARAIGVCDDASEVQADFDEKVRARLAALDGLGALLAVVASMLEPGRRVTAEKIVSALAEKLKE